MIDPGIIDLIIFDLDGTLSVTTRPIYHAVQKAFDNLGISLTMTGEDMERYFGAPSPEFYVALTPPDCGVSWQAVKEEIHKEQAAAFREFGETYPGVAETLATLRKRDYKLALYSNSTPGYFNPVISALGIGDLFDYRECIGENNLTKNLLVKKIINHFGNPAATVVGDRIHDIEAARENGALSIGALYGYGGKEPEESDITISTFSDLLDVFDRRFPVFQRILDEINRRKDPGRPFVTGITGIDGAGKTVFTDAFKTFLQEKGFPVQVIHVDDFHNPKQIRYSGDNEEDNYFNLSFNYPIIIDGLLAPLREKPEYTTELTLLNLETDSYDTTKRYTFTPETVVIFEGVFLLRKELQPYIDLSVFLDIPPAESKARAITRDPEAVLSRYESKYMPAQARYLKLYPPDHHADMIIDNLNWNHPVIDRIKD